MSIERLTIHAFLEQSKNALVLDVRSPAEYSHAHMPGAVSLPLFTDEERKVVGTAYKQNSREAAIKIGLDYFGPKMRAMVENTEALAAAKNTKQVFVYCWRGGMRSAAVAWLLNLYGFKVFALNGGYKAFRNWALETLAFPYRLHLIGGFTGSGKTLMLEELQKRGELVINLEALAVHKGSAFGNIGMPPQPSQEMFENLLAQELAAKHQVAQLLSQPNKTKEGKIGPQAKPIWIEDESQRIGTINLPNAFWDNMRKAPLYFVDIPFEARLQHLAGVYGCLDKESMINAIERISKRLGPLQTKNAIAYLREDNISESFRILLQYYDKHYLKALHNRQNLSLLLNKIVCTSVDTDNIQYLLSKPMTA